MNPNLFTWILAGFGLITFLPLLLAQVVLITAPGSRNATDLIIGKGEAWRDETHFRSALSFAWGDILLLLPALALSYFGVLGGHIWGYVLWFALGLLSVYFSILFWVLERAYTYPAVGPFRYYTYFWGFFLYWGIGAIVHASIQLF